MKKPYEQFEQDVKFIACGAMKGPIREEDYYQKPHEKRRGTVKEVSDRLIADHQWDGLFSALVVGGISEGFNRQKNGITDPYWYASYFPDKGKPAPLPRGLTAKRLYEMALIAYEMVPDGSLILAIEEMMLQVGRIAAI